MMGCEKFGGYIPREEQEVYDYSSEAFSIEQAAQEVGIREGESEFDPENDRVMFSEREHDLYNRAREIIQRVWDSFNPQSDVLLLRYLRRLQTRTETDAAVMTDPDELVRLGAEQKMHSPKEADAYKAELQRLYQSLGIESGLKSEDALHCLQDVRRTMRFFKTIFEKVRAGDRVLEAGAGSGVLALAAAQAGAKEVLSIEINPYTAVFARNVVRECESQGLIPPGVVKIKLGDATKFAPPDGTQPYDVLVSENLYTGQFYEVGIQITNNLTQFVDTKQGKVIPRGMLSGVELASLPPDVRQRIGKRTDVVTREYAPAAALKKQSGARYYDYYQLADREALGFRNRIVEVASHSGTVDALNIFSLVQMSAQKGDVLLRGEADFLGNDHLVLLEQPLAVEEGDEIVIELAYRGGDAPGQADIKVQNNRTGQGTMNRREQEVRQAA